jgi:hypothetical protein
MLMASTLMCKFRALEGLERRFSSTVLKQIRRVRQENTTAASGGAIAYAILHLLLLTPERLNQALITCGHQMVSARL